MGKKVIKIAIANYSYLGTIAKPIKDRLKDSEYKPEFVERSQEEIQEILDLASEERFISGESIQISQFDENAVLEAIKETSENSDDNFSLQFDEEPIEQTIEEEDLEDEMMQSKIQNAAGKILIHSVKSDFSDIHIEPKDDEYKIRKK